MAKKQASKPRKRRAPSPPPFSRPVHAKLKDLVEARQGARTLADIAEAANMSKAAFSRLLNGDIADPRIKTLMDVLRAIGATLADFEQA